MDGSNRKFEIQNEDFPALPGLNNQSSTGNTFDRDGYKRSALGMLNQGGAKVPPGLVTNPFGMTGISLFLNSMSSRNGLFGLALGHDLTNFGLDVNSRERNLHQSFAGPFSDSPARTQDIECNVPTEYRISQHLKNKLPPIDMNKLCEDSLLYLFYNCPGEAYQMAAAHELHSRDWRYHKSLKAWLTRSSYENVKEQTSTFEKGLYYVFDPVQWKKILKEMTLEYKDLEHRPTPLTTDFKHTPMAAQRNNFPSNVAPPTEAQQSNFPSNLAPPHLATSNLGAGVDWKKSDF